jgi:hypothetical protein
MYSFWEQTRLCQEATKFPNLQEHTKQPSHNQSYWPALHQQRISRARYSYLHWTQFGSALMVPSTVGPAGLWTKNDSVGEGQQQFILPNERPTDRPLSSAHLEAAVIDYQLLVMSVASSTLRHDAWKLQSVHLLGGASLSTFTWQYGMQRCWTANCW